MGSTNSSGDIVIFWNQANWIVMPWYIDPKFLVPICTLAGSLITFLFKYIQDNASQNIASFETLKKAYQEEFHSYQAKFEEQTELVKKLTSQVSSAVTEEKKCVKRYNELLASYHELLNKYQNILDKYEELKNEVKSLKNKK